MEPDKRLEALENEIKLLKNEVKQTLINIREFLMGIKLPLPADEVEQEEKQSEFDELSIPVQNIDSPGASPSGLVPEKAYIPPGNSAKVPEDILSEAPVTPQAIEEVPPPCDIPAEDNELLEEESLSLSETSEPPVEKQSNIEQPEEENMKESPVNQPVSQVNLLANLIRWISEAKKEIGSEQLSAFLDVYSITGNLPIESKEVIQHMASIISQQTADQDMTDVWTRLTLELHGILSGGGQPLRLPDLDVTKQEDNGKQDNAGANTDKLVKLKLVFPGDNGEEKEFGITLSPDGNGKHI